MGYKPFAERRVDLWQKEMPSPIGDGIFANLINPEEAEAASPFFRRRTASHTNASAIDKRIWAAFSMRAVRFKTGATVGQKVAISLQSGCPINM